ncbi:CBL-interacting serine/threonine-protein kinase 4 [Morus notabilis]|nr:CBL-interacting serine/threonine-protein kinase 4 [Morus notabilis]
MEREGVPPPPPPPPSPTTATTILGKYRLGRFLGSGSFAKVYEAQSLSDGSTVAVKIIDKKSKTFDAAMESLIIGEIEAMRRLKHHPNILRIHEVMATKTKIFLVMELAAGGELLKRIKGKKIMKESEARRHFQQLVSALRFCHRNGVAHRDVKPQNLLLDRDGRLKVSDFGLSALPERIKNGMLHTACGTPAFTAPEILFRRGGGYDGAKADAWSCGVILHVMLAGRLPFSDLNLAGMCKQIHRREIDIPDSISKTVRKLIYGLLDPNPGTRISIERLVELPWFKKSLPLEPDNPIYKCDRDYDLVAANAFEIISLSSGLDLSGLFGARRKERRFATGMTAEEAVEG